MTADPVEDALVSERLRLLHAAEEAERALQQELLIIGRENRDLTRELVEQGRRREEREMEALRVEVGRRAASAEAETRRVDADIEERKTMRAWLRSVAGDKVVPLLVGAASTAIAALGAWWASS